MTEVNVKLLLIPGPAHGVLAEALDLDPETATVEQMVQEIARLKMAAAEGKKKPKSVKRSILVNARGKKDIDGDSNSD